MQNKTKLILPFVIGILVSVVLALSGCGSSSPAAAGGGGTGGGTTVTGVPTGVTAIAGNTQNIISWNAVTGATSYNIYGGTTASAAVKGGILIASTTTSPFTHTGLINGSIYYYVITAVSGSGESAASTMITATPNTPPAAPTGLAAATISSKQINLTWTANANATSYNIYRGTTPGFALAGNKIASTATASFNDVGLTANTLYYYQVTAVNGAGESAPSAANATTRLAAPTGLLAIGSSTTSIQISWQPVTGAASYDVYCYAGPASLLLFPTNTTANTITITGLTAGTAYTYYIIPKTAANVAGDSSTPLAAYTWWNAPTGVTATFGSYNTATDPLTGAVTRLSSNINLSWTAPGTLPVGFGYQINRFFTILTPGITTTNTIYTDICPITTTGTTIPYIVRIVDANGNPYSVWSAQGACKLP